MYYLYSRLLPLAVRSGFNGRWIDALRHKPWESDVSRHKRGEIIPNSATASLFWEAHVAFASWPRDIMGKPGCLTLQNATRAQGGGCPGVTLRHQRDPWRGFSLTWALYPHPTLGSGVAISHTRLDARRLSPILGHGGNTNGRCVDYPVPILRGRW